VGRHQPNDESGYGSGREGRENRFPFPSRFRARCEALTLEPSEAGADAGAGGGSLLGECVGRTGAIP